MKAQPEHADVLNLVHELCESTISKLESALTKQRELDAAKAKRKEDEAQTKEEMARAEAERKERERQEKAKKLAQDKLDIQAVECDLLAWKQAYNNAQRAATTVDSGNEDDKDKDNIQSVVEEPKVCLIHL